MIGNLNMSDFIAFFLQLRLLLVENFFFTHLGWLLNLLMMQKSQEVARKAVALLFKGANTKSLFFMYGSVKMFSYYTFIY